MIASRALRLIVLGIALLAAACGATSGPPMPREIVAGVDVCAYCHMTVDDPERAAQWLEQGGKTLLFDEPGCLVAWLAERAGAVGEAYFGDAEGTGWVPAAEVVFVRGGASTGMGFDIVAYRSREVAERIAAERGGTVLDWGTLVREGVGDVHAH